MTMQTQAVAAEAVHDEDEAIAHEAGDAGVDDGLPGEEEVVAIITEEVIEIEMVVEESAEDAPDGETEDQPSATVMRHPHLATI